MDLPPNDSHPSSPTSLYSLSGETVSGQLSPAWSSGCSSTDTLVEDNNDASEIPSPISPLLLAIVRGKADEAEKLATQGLTVPANDTWVLYRACIHGVDMIRALMSNPAIDFDQEVPLGNGRTIHHLLRTPAADFTGSKVETVQFLLEIGVNPFSRDMLGDTALHILAGPVNRSVPLPMPTGSSKVATPEFHSHPESEFNSLLEPESQTLLCHLLSMISEGRFAMLIEDPIDMTNNYGNTALVVALLYRNVVGAKILLECGADPHIRGELNLFGN